MSDLEDFEGERAAAPSGKKGYVAYDAIVPDDALSSTFLTGTGERGVSRPGSRVGSRPGSRASRPGSGNSAISISRVRVGSRSGSRTARSRPTSSRLLKKAERQSYFYDEDWLGQLKSGRRYRSPSRINGSNYGMHGYKSKPGDRDIWSKWREMKYRMEHDDVKVKNIQANSNSSFDMVGKKIANALESSSAKDGLLKSHLDVVHNLHLMEKVWLQAADGLTEEEFTQFLSAILELPPEELSVLYQKMDANSDGSLTWDEYLSYLLREVTHKWHFHSARGTWHLRDEPEQPLCSLGASASQILHIPGDAIANVPGKYVVACKDGTVQIWNSTTLTHMGDLPEPEYNVISSNAPRAKSVLVHGGAQTARSNSGAPTKSYRKPNLLLSPSVAYYETAKQIVTANMDKSINFYALSFRQYQVCRSFKCNNTPQCMMVAHNAPTRSDLLIVGDTTGVCSLYNPATQKLQIAKDLHNGESVRRVALYQNMGILSAGMDAKLCMTDPSRFSVVRTLEGHKRGVYAFANCPSFRCIVSAGFDRKVLVWDPYISEPTGYLNSHHTKIVDVCVNEDKNQIITTCADKKIKIFDIRTFKCIHELVDQTEYQPDELSAAMFDHDHERLVTAGTKLRVWPIQIAPGNKSIKGGPAHGDLIVAVLFSKAFEQIISIGVDENVRIWDVHKGKNMFEFNTSHNSPITAACLDPRGKRLITGAHDGTVMMWNFNNGDRIHIFQARSREISELVFLTRTALPLLGIGWEKSLVRWPDSNVPKNVRCSMQEGHMADIGAVCASPDSSLMVTGDMDGDILVWTVDRNLPMKKLKLPKTKPGSRQAARIVDGRKPRTGISKLAILSYPGKEKSFFFLIAGTENGCVHFIDLRDCTFVHKIDGALADGVSGISFDTEIGNHTRHTRLMLTDIGKQAVLYDISRLSVNSIGSSMTKLKQWFPHPEGTSINVLNRIDALNVFVTGSDSGNIFAWNNEGVKMCSFGQRHAWPLRLRDFEMSDRDRMLETEIFGGTDDADSDEETTQFDRNKDDGESEVRRVTPYLESHSLYQPPTLTKAGLRSSGFDIKQKKGKTVYKKVEVSPEYKSVGLYNKLEELDKQLHAIYKESVEEGERATRRGGSISFKRRSAKKNKEGQIQDLMKSTIDNGSNEQKIPRRPRPNPTQRKFYPMPSGRPRRV